jgi:hypothetical protein
MAQAQRILGRRANGPEGFGVPQASLAVSERIQSLGLGDFDALQVPLASSERIQPSGLGDFDALRVSLAGPEQTQPSELGDFDVLRVSLEDPERIRSSGPKGEARQRQVPSFPIKGFFARRISRISSNA